MVNLSKLTLYSNVDSFENFDRGSVDFTISGTYPASSHTESTVQSSAFSKPNKIAQFYVGKDKFVGGGEDTIPSADHLVYFVGFLADVVESTGSIGTLFVRIYPEIADGKVRVKTVTVNPDSSSVTATTTTFTVHYYAYAETN